MSILEAEYGSGAVRVGRALRGFSQVQLAQLTGIRHSRLFQIEHGLVRPTADEWAAITRWLRPTQQEWAAIWGCLTSE
jgi:transcriptional regulator with XRE-family HTH domain